MLRGTRFAREKHAMWRMIPHIGSNDLHVRRLHVNSDGGRSLSHLTNFMHERNDTSRTQNKIHTPVINFKSRFREMVARFVFNPFETIFQVLY